MSITYTYTVLSVDAELKSMDVLYESAGRRTFKVTAPLPDEGQTLSAQVAKHAPVALWESYARAVTTVAPGATGEITAAPTVLITPGMSFRDFYGLFTDAEKNALIGATQTDVQTKRRYDELLTLNLVSTAPPEVEMLLSQLVTLGALTGARKTAILAALPEAA